MPTEGEYWIEAVPEEDGCQPPDAPVLISTPTVLLDSGADVNAYATAQLLAGETGFTIETVSLPCGACRICPDPCCTWATYPTGFWPATLTATLTGADDCATCPDGGDPPPATFTLTKVPSGFAGGIWYGTFDACGYTYEVCWFCDGGGAMRLSITNHTGDVTEGTEAVLYDGRCGCWYYSAAIGTSCGPAGGTLFVVVGDCLDAGPGSPSTPSFPALYPCASPTDDQPDRWWIQKDKTVVQNNTDVPVDWLGGPHPTEAIAKYWVDQIGDRAFCVEWHDHADGEIPVDEDPAVPTLRDSLPATAGDYYVECLTETQITDATTDATLVKVAYLVGRLPDDTPVYDYFWEWWGCPPRFPLGTFKDEPSPGDNPDAEVRPTVEAPPRLRKMRISRGGDFTGTTLASTAPDGLGGWYTEVEEFVTDDACPGEAYTPGQPNLCTDGVTVRFTFPPDFLTDLPSPLEWSGYTSRRSNVEKCRENCPPCHRPRWCRIPDGEGGFVIVEEPEVAGTDWNYSLPASNNVVGDAYYDHRLCEWLCSDPCFKSLYPLFCDPDYPGFIGCEDRERPAMSPASPVGRKTAVRRAPVAVRTVSPSPAAERDFGPGTALKLVLLSLGLTATSGCGCEDKARQMDEWGADGCRSRRPEIEKWLREQQAKRGWLDKLRAAALAVKTGLAFRLDPTDPAPGLLDEALRLYDESVTRRTAGK